jgi:pseudouridine kinase
MKPTMDGSEKTALIIGAAGLDVVGRLAGKPASGTSNPGEVRMSYGGVARNVAENLVRLGTRVEFISVVGNDITGKHLLDYLTMLGIGIGGCLLSDTTPTGVYLASLLPDGSRYHAVVDRRGMIDLSSTWIKAKADLFKNAEIIFLDANLKPEAIKAVYSLAKKYHVPVCADPTSTSLTCRLQPYLKQTEVLTLNSAEAADLSGTEYDLTNLESNFMAGRRLRDQGVGTVIIAMGAYGVCYVDADTKGHIPAISTPVIDPTGAGDAFTAAVLYGRMNDLTIDDSIRLGVSAASLTIRSPGSVVHDLSLEMLYGNLII